MGIEDRVAKLELQILELAKTINRMMISLEKQAQTTNLIIDVMERTGSEPFMEPQHDS